MGIFEWIKKTILEEEKMDSSTNMIDDIINRLEKFNEQFNNKADEIDLLLKETQELLGGLK